MIVALGGGRGLSSTVLALKLAGLDFGAVVATTDNGGSTGRLRRMYGIPAVGDLRRIIDVLSPFGEIMEKRIEGHALGNLVLFQLVMENRLVEAVEKYRKAMGVENRVEPSLVNACDLAARIDGKEIVGEEQIDNSVGFVEDMWVEPKGEVNERAVELVENADYVILGPGSIFTSILPHLLVEEIRKAVREANTIYIANISNDSRIVENFCLSDYLEVLKRLGRIKPEVVIAQKPEMGIEIDVNCLTDDVARDDHFHDPAKLKAAILKVLKSG